MHIKRKKARQIQKVEMNFLRRTAGYGYKKQQEKEYQNKEIVTNTVHKRTLTRTYN